jgi:hypothetical protein
MTDYDLWKVFCLSFFVLLIGARIASDMRREARRRR